MVNRYDLREGLSEKGKMIRSTKEARTAASARVLRPMGHWTAQKCRAICRAQYENAEQNAAQDSTA